MATKTKPMKQRASIMPTPEREPTPQELLAKLEATNDAKLRACHQEIGQILTRHGCALVAIPQINPDGTIGAFCRVVLADQGHPAHQ